MRDLLEFLQDGRDTGELTVPDLDLTTNFLFAGLHTVLTQGLRKPGTAMAAVTTVQKLVRRILSA